MIQGINMKLKFVTVVCIFLLAVCIKEISLQDIINSGALVDGDIMLSEEVNSLIKTAEGIDMKNRRWPRGIVPYAFNQTEYSLLDVHVIQEGMKEIESDTCIRFIPRKIHHPDFLYITPNEGCWSYLGRKGSGQTLSLVAPQCMDKGTVIHELMHALGFWHEHSRPDRDDYVQVLWDNIIDKEKQANFEKHHFNSWNDWTELPYDYKSVLHYSAYAFSRKPTLPTLLPKRRNIRLKELGRAKVVGTLTDLDRMKINLFYECSISG